MSVDVMLLCDHEGDEDHGNPTRKVRCIQNYEYVELLSVTNECVERGKEYYANYYKLTGNINFHI